MTNPLHIGLDAWIIQDGNYGEIESGRELDFALEFEARERLEPVGHPITSQLQHQSRNLYSASGVVIHCSKDVWVCDFGVPAYAQECPPEWARTGAAVKGEISLVVDPFPYFERLKKRFGMPNLTRRWRVESIELETTPWLEEPFRRRDETRYSFRQVSTTDAWDDDSGNAFYVLKCSICSAV